MELRQLIYFEAVVRCGGFTRAAEQLHIAQPAVSAQIRQLESELGVALLARTTRKVSLTYAGEVFLARARRVLEELNAARGDLAELTGLHRGRVVIGATALLGPLDLPAVLAGFHRQHPGIDLSLRSGLIAELLASLDRGDVDLVLGPIHADLAPQYSARRLFDEGLVLVTSPGHRLARLARISLEQVKGEPFVCLPAGSGLHLLLLATAATAGFVPDVRFETHTPDSIRALVSAGLGVAVLARSVAGGLGPPVSVHELEPEAVHPPIGLIHHRDHRLSPAAQTCRRHLAAVTDSL
jgi:LysR family transcriptional activator of glutamate synthase operon